MAGLDQAQPLTSYSKRPEYVECAYCGAEVEDEGEYVPTVGDDTEWERIAEGHYYGCEWIDTRAHRE
jgi:hypothetical protein